MLETLLNLELQVDIIKLCRQVIMLLVQTISRKD